MRWFEGDISEAITLSKQRNAVFVVFIHGGDDASNATLAAIDSPEVSDKLSTNDFVAIKLESGSQPYHQFVQIYQLVPVPSLFFIGQSGVPLHVVPGQTTSAVLMEHISVIGKLALGASIQQASTSGENIPAAKEVSPVPIVTKAESSISKQSGSSVSDAKEAMLNAPEQSQEPTETLEQRIKRAEQARAALAVKKQKEEEEQEREREQARRREGEELAQARRSRDALEAQQALEERRREREQEREARDRVLQQIAQDKLERASRMAAEKGVSPPPPAASVTTSMPAPITAARLQFRLPNGSSHTHVFEPEALLGEVRQYVRSKLHPAVFSLSMAFPRAELGTEDDARSLQDLGLVPSAALLVLPASSSSGAVSSTGTGLMGMLWLLLTPFTVLWSLVSSRIWGEPTNPPPSSQSGPGSAGAAAQARASQSDVRHRVRQDGNIHRLAGSQDSDDENNTYNGNSTQQM